MNHLEKIIQIYSDFLFGDENYPLMRTWAAECLSDRAFDIDENVILIASSSDNQETIDLVRRFLTAQEILSSLEPSESDLLHKIGREFPLQPLPKKITNYLENDPQDYDGEAQSVTEHYLNQEWNDRAPLSNALNYYNDTAFAYYLPAFLQVAISEKEKHSATTQRLFRELARGDRKSAIELLSTAQKKITFSVLRNLQFSSKSYFDDCKAIRDNFEPTHGEHITCC